jgi:uncharacterized protein
MQGVQHTMQVDLTGTIQALYQFPIKGVAGNLLTESIITNVGLQHDRQWLIVDESGRFITQRQIPHLVWILAQATDKGLILNAPNQTELLVPLVQTHSPHTPNTITVQIWRDSVTALDCGEVPAKWVTQYLDIPGKSFRLVQAHTEHPRSADLKGTTLPRTPNWFSDGYGLNILSQASMTALNDRLAEVGHEPVDALRFRSNIILAGLLPHEEDSIESLTIHSSYGPVMISMVKPCTRCAVPNINPFTAISSPEVNDTLAGYRRLISMNDEICFAMNAIVTQGAGHIVKVGDPIEATLKLSL